MDGIRDKLDIPSSHTVEITLFGGCNGFGESVLLHLRDNIWVVIDCCVDAKGYPLPLSYLEEIGVPIENVKYIICTHWHTDHIKGMSELLRRCSPENTTFYTSLTPEDEVLVSEFIKDGLLGGNKGKEILETIETLDDTHINTYHVYQDRLMFEEKGSLCYALSPSDHDVNAFLQEQALNTFIVKKRKAQKQSLHSAESLEVENAEDVIASTFDSYGLEEQKEILPVDKEPYRTKKMKLPKPNCRSVAMLLTIGGQHIVLGADLETDDKNENSGWSAILRHSVCMRDKKADVYKIPHHGSVTGHMQDFIDAHVNPGCLAKMTTWYKGGNLLPQDDMIEKYSELTDKLYITSPPNKTRKIDAPSNNVRNMIEESVEDVFDIPQRIGFIRSRLNLDEDEATREWETKCFGAAYRIKKS